MKTKIILTSLWIALFSVSCTTNGDEKQKSTLANKVSIKYDSGKGGFNYYLSDNGKSTILRSEDGKDRYAHDEFYFVGELTDYASAQKNKEIEDAIEDYYYEMAKENPDFTVRDAVYYCTDLINEINIYSDKNFNGIAAGQSLNSHFVVVGDFISRMDNQYVAFYTGNILESNLLKEGNLVFPREFYILLKNTPEVEDTYTFYMEIKGEGISEQKQISVIGLK
ncbi:MAG: hypothetical protein LBF89_02415 [Bacteroidales bacterium]|nr:hypothetical protein [Bacteroidales bacterium]